MKALLILLALSGVAHARGANVDIHFEQVPLVDVTRLLGDVGRVNIVLVGVPAETKVDVKVKRVPWDTVLADIVARSKLASVREGIVILIGDPAMIAARKKAKRTFKGPVIDVDLRDADAAAAALLIARATNKPVAITGGTKPVSQRLRRVPMEQALDVAVLASGGAVAKQALAAKPAGCVAGTTETVSLKLAGVARSGITRHALIVDGGIAYVVTKGDCVGKDQAVIKDIGDNYLTAKLANEEASLSLYPRSQ